jgi:diguanylate cyclase (GGDEF)-like protein
MTTSTTTTALPQTAPWSTGDLDVFVFRRVTDGSYAHLGGQGRGEGWAGIVQLDLADEPALCRAISEQLVVVHSTSTPTRVFGPYWSTEALLVPRGRDELVVIGGRGATLIPPDQRHSIASAASESVAEVGPAKRLADELEVLHVVRDIALAPLTHLDEVATRVLRQATAALSCELGVLSLPSSNVLVVHDDGAPGKVSTEQAADLVQAFTGRDNPTQRCFQELTASDRAALPDISEEILSLLSIPLDVEPGAVLLLAHTTSGPRGFTDLCRDIATHIADAARNVLMASILHDHLHRRAQDADALARTDNLTGLLNRRGWDDAIAAVDSSEPLVSVILADGNGLKRVNDNEGHEAGDHHIAAWAAAFRLHVRDRDPLARIGGDEFGVLLVGADEQRARAVIEQVRAELGEGPLDTSVAIGTATGTGADVAELVRQADTAMYLDKGTDRRD